MDEIGDGLGGTKGKVNTWWYELPFTGNFYLNTNVASLLLKNIY